MTTKETAQKYFDGLSQKNGWESFVSDEIVFTSPGNQTKGKAAYLDATSGFLRVVKKVEIKELITEGDKVCVMAKYDLQSPKGNEAVCITAEILLIKNRKIESSTIFFDTAAFSSFKAQG